MATKKNQKTVKKPVGKKPAAKKAAPKKPAAKKVSAKKPVVKKPAAKKPAAKKPAAAKKPIAPKSPAKKPAVKKPVVKAAQPVAAKKPAAPEVKKPMYEPIPTLKQTQAAKTKTASAQKQERFSAADLKLFKRQMLEMRERLLYHADTMKDMALKGMDDVNPEEDGTDAHMRMVTLQQLGTQRTILAKIEESLVAIEKGTYGICDNCGCRIGKQRLQAQPFSKTCINCQSEMERSL